VGLTSLGVGLAAAGAGALLGVAAERLAVGRPILAPFREKQQEDPEPYGRLHADAALVVRTPDGATLHVEIDEVERSGWFSDEPELTVVFCHGYALTMDSWHFQRKAMRGRHRLVLWDQRGHGRSGTPRGGPGNGATIEQLGADLKAVLDEVVPTGPIVLVGHSMGGMTVMSLAEAHPNLFQDRVIAVALVSTSAGGLRDMDFGLPRVGRFVRQLAPSAARALNRTPHLVARGRRLGSDLELVLVRRYSYASPVSPALARFTASMIASTRLDVISDFLPVFSEHDKRQALAAMSSTQVLVLVGDSDLLTPVDHSADIVNRLPEAEHVVVRNGGHLVMLEHPDLVNEYLDRLIDRAATGRP
jgi:pimeloyl-ACP methyl ester carboxylesterase